MGIVNSSAKASCNASELSYPNMQDSTERAQVIKESEASILQRHEKLIRHQAKPFAGKGVDIEDLMQEGRIALLTASRTYVPGSGTLWTAARMAVFGAILRYVNYVNKDPQSKGESGECLLDEVDNSPSPLDVLEMEQTLSVLSEKERELVNLVFAGGLTAKDVAVTLNIPQGSVDAMLKRAIGKMRAVVIGS